MYSLLVGFSLQPMETDGTDPNGPAPPSARPIGSWGWIELAHSSARRHELAQLEMRDRRVRLVGLERAPDRVPAIASDRRLDRSLARTRPAAHQRQILALDLAPAHEPAQPEKGRFAAGHDHQPRGVAVEPVDDAGPLGRLSPARSVCDQSVRQRPGRSAGARMNRDAGRLIDYEQVLVLVDESERSLLARERRVWRRRLVLDRLAAASR